MSSNEVAYLFIEYVNILFFKMLIRAFIFIDHLWRNTQKLVRVIASRKRTRGLRYTGGMDITFVPLELFDHVGIISLKQYTSKINGQKYGFGEVMTHSYIHLK